METKKKATIVSSLIVVVLVITSFAIYNEFGIKRNKSPAPEVASFSVFTHNNSTSMTGNFTQYNSNPNILLIGPSAGQIYLLASPSNNSSIKLQIEG